MLRYGNGADRINENSRYTMYALESAWDSVEGGRRGKVKSEEIASSRELTEASGTSQIGKGRNV